MNNKVNGAYGTDSFCSKHWLVLIRTFQTRRPHWFPSAVVRSQCKFCEIPLKTKTIFFILYIRNILEEKNWMLDTWRDFCSKLTESHLDFSVFLAATEFVLCGSYLRLSAIPVMRLILPLKLTVKHNVYFGSIRKCRSASVMTVMWYK